MHPAAALTCTWGRPPRRGLPITGRASFLPGVKRVMTSPSIDCVPPPASL
jgi:hypothetical protein